jgi:hypothetical protein
MFHLWSTYWFWSRFSSITSVSLLIFIPPNVARLLINLSSTLYIPDTHSVVRQSTEEKHVNIYLILPVFWEYMFFLSARFSNHWPLPANTHSTVPEFARNCCFASADSFHSSVDLLHRYTLSPSSEESINPFYMSTDQYKILRLISSGSSHTSVYL